MQKILFYLLVFLAIAPYCAAQSVLSSGKWIRFQTEGEGIYRITYEEIENWGLSPNEVCIYGTGGAPLSETTPQIEGETLREIPVYVEKGSDQVFGKGDYILFYGEGLRTRSFSEQEGYIHVQHPYAPACYYYLSSRTDAQRIQTVNQTYTSTCEVTTFDDFQVYEKDESNVQSSGRLWLGEYLGIAQNPVTVDFEFPDRDISQTIQATVQLAIRSNKTTYLNVLANQQPICHQSLYTVDYAATSDYAALQQINIAQIEADNASQVHLSLSIEGNGFDAWLDYVRVLSRRQLILRNTPLFFRDYYSVGANQYAQFVIQEATASTQVWDITNRHQIVSYPLTAKNNGFAFVADASSLREYVAFNASSTFLTPTWLETRQAQVENQDLYQTEAADLIIVTHPDFIQAAEELAEIHRNRDLLKVSVVTTSQIYHAFSGGKTDPAAIRDFFKWQYDRYATHPHRLKYAILLGDGTYDNRAITTSSNEQWVVTYQSENSLSPVSSFTSDDYFGMLDDEESVLDGDLEISVGRLPAKSLTEALAIVHKIDRYINQSPQGNWRRTLCFMADDEDDNAHLTQIEQMTSHISEQYPAYQIQKIYLEGYEQTTTLNGHRYPDAENDFQQALKNGMLLFNYTGHGNETGLTNERVIYVNDIETWNNSIYPLFITASCEFGRYDNHALVTAAEKVLLNPSGGGIGLLSSTRLVYSDLNALLNQQFYQYAFEAGNDTTPHRLGDILRQAKNAAHAGINSLSFALLGDPALQLPTPTGSVKTLQINAKDASAFTDTIRALEPLTLSGQIYLADGTPDYLFEGTVQVSLYDKPDSLQTRDNDGLSGIVKYEANFSALFNGSCSVQQGQFRLSFTVPRDIDFSAGMGKITCYATGDSYDALGSQSLMIGGSASSSTRDTIGPEIRLYLNDTLFRSGGLTDEQPTLLALLKDENGINTSDVSIGHQLYLTLNATNGSSSRQWQVNDYYTADTDLPLQGRIAYQLPVLSPGYYNLTLQAYDIYNNLSESTLPFRVIKQHQVSVLKMYNYPNPFHDVTHFYFEHNQPDADIDVTLSIFSLSGALVHTLHTTLPAGSYTSQDLKWDGTASNGNKIQPGIYLYRLILRFSTGETVTRTNKLMVQ